MLWNNKGKNLGERNNRFSIRKLTVGAASVMIGAFFMGIETNQVVHADTVENQTVQVATNKTKEKASSQATNQAALEDAQKLVSKDNTKVLDEADAKTVHETVHYKDEDTHETVSSDKKQDVTFVPYYKKATATVNYIDDTDGKTLDTDTVKGYVGNQTPYNGESQITSWENKGYKLVSNDIPKQGIKFENGGVSSYSVHFIHDTKEISDLIPVTRTIHYKGAGEKTPEDVKQDVTFNATGTKDKVTGEESLTWDKDKRLDSVTSPEIDGYHITNVSQDSKDGKNVDAVTVSHDNKDYTVTVTYAPNGTEIRGGQSIPSKQTINFEDEDGNVLKDPGIQKSTFTYSGDTYDKVTGKKLSDGSWNETSHTYKTINVPKIDGYIVKDGQKVAGGLTATLDNPNVETTVIYAKLVDGSVTYHDDTDDKDLKIDQLPSAKAGDKIDYITQDKIDGYLDQGYELVSNPFTDGSQTYSKDVGKNKFIVHLKHGIKDISSDKTVTRTINYLDNSGKTVAESHKDSVTFQGTGTQDKVTGQKSALTWSVKSGNADFIKITSPTIEGMHVDRVTPENEADGNDVKAHSVTKDSSDIVVNVYYTKNGTELRNQKEIKSTQTVKYVDKDGQELATPNKQSNTLTYTGDTYDKVTGKLIKKGNWKDGKDSYTYSSVIIPTIEGYEATSGYITNNDSQKVAGGNWTVSSATPSDDLNKVFTVVYKKATQTQHATVIYRDTDKNNEQIATSGDLTGKSGEKINYSSADTLADLENKGYVLDVNGYDSNGEAPSFDKDTAQNQTFYVDLKHGTQPVNPENPGTPDQPINPNDPDGPKYPTGTDKNSLTKTVTRTINYVDEEGKNLADPVSQDAKFTASGVLDKVTGEWITSLTWSKDQSFVGVTSPTIDGYQIKSVDKDAAGNNVAAKSVTHDDSSYTVTVTYEKQAAKGSITYVDNTTNQALENADFEGKVGDTINYTTADRIEHYEGLGYTLVSNNFIDGLTKYKKSDNDYQVVLKHSVETEPISKTITRKVNYIFTDGTTPSDHNMSNVNDTFTFNGTKSTDQVTHESTIKWDNDSHTFNATAEIPSGYIITSIKNTDKKLSVNETTGVVGAITVTPTSSDLTIDITLTKKAPEVVKTSGSITYIDDTTGKTLESTTFEGNVGDTISYKATNRINYYEGLGYKLVSNNFTDSKEVFNKDASKNIFEVHFAHNTTSVTPENPGITPSPLSLYVSLIAVTASKDQDEYDYSDPKTATKYYLVYKGGKLVAQDVSENAAKSEFDDVESPDLSNKGYYLVEGNPTVVKGSGVDLKSADIDKTVYYSNKQHAVVIYRDTDEGNKQIATSGDLTGKSNEKINYSSANTLSDLENKGYVLVKNGYDPTGEAPSFDNDKTQSQTFYLDLKHGTQPVDPDHPGKPDQPINPNDPESPKYPKGTDANSLQKTVTRTIHYQGAGQYTPKDVTQPVTFTQSGVLDKVTGKWITPLTWSEDQNFAKVESPTIDGYKIINVDRDAEGNDVAAKSVNRTTEDYTVTVTYDKVTTPITPDPTPTVIEGSVTYIDDTTGKTLRKDTFSGNVGDKVNYTTQDKIDDYENQGYQLVSNNFRDGLEVIKASGNDYEVHLTTTKNPPDEPEDPIDNPDTPVTPTTTPKKGQYRPTAVKATVFKPVHKSVKISKQQVVPSNKPQAVIKDNNQALPQTGAKQNVAAQVLGALAFGLGGLTGAAEVLRKKRKN